MFARARTIGAFHAGLERAPQRAGTASLRAGTPSHNLGVPLANLQTGSCRKPLRLTALPPCYSFYLGSTVEVLFSPAGTCIDIGVSLAGCRDLEGLVPAGETVSLPVAVRLRIPPRPELSTPLRAFCICNIPVGRFSTQFRCPSIGFGHFDCRSGFAHTVFVPARQLFRLRDPLLLSSPWLSSLTRTEALSAPT